MSGKENNSSSILVVEDDSMMLNLTVQILRTMGFENVDTALNGKIALAKLTSSEKPFDLIICDLNMPEMDGFEFMRHAKESNFTGGLILFSGEDARMLEITREMAAELNLNILGAIAKPVTPNALQELLENFQPVKSSWQNAGKQEPLTVDELETGIHGNAEGLLLYFQPIVHIRSGEISAVEALARWNHPRRGILEPHTFIPLAEECGLMDELTHQVYKKAAKQTAEWVANGYYIKTSVNFTVSAISNADFAERIIRSTEAAGLSPSQMVLEVDEREVLLNTAACIEVLMRMRFKKFELSIDDFGLGNATLDQIKRIPFSELKIARNFVHSAARNAEARTKLESSLALAKALKMESVAKGVENREDWNLVETLGYESVQGSFCGRAMSNEELIDHMDSWRAPPRTSRL